MKTATQSSGPGSTRSRDRRRESGHAMVEVALMSPWLLLLFAGIFNFGFYAYAAIGTQSAASVAALYTSSESSLAADAAGACQYAIRELRWVPGVGGATSCADLPLRLTAVATPSPCVTGQPCDSAVTVTVRTVPLFTIPGLMERMTLSRTATMRVHPDL